MPFVDPPYFATVHWGQREDERDPDSPLLEIRPGELDAATTAIRRLWYQLQNGIEWPRLMTFIGEQWAEQERALGSVDQARYLSTAEGVVLDEIGALVNRARAGLSDDLYRLAIRAEAGSIFASGTIPEIVELTRSLLGDDLRVREHFPGLVVVSAPDVAVDVFLVLLQVLADVPAAGVAGILETWDSSATGVLESTTGGTSGTSGAYSSTTGYEAPVGFYSTGQVME